MEKIVCRRESLKRLNKLFAKMTSEKKKNTMLQQKKRFAQEHG